MTELIAFHNDPTLKQFVLAQLAEHREADKLVKGSYWQDGHGCAVGCTLQAVALRNGHLDIDHSSHGLYETELGIPRILARLEDRIFEALPTADAQQWPERFTGAIRPGADLTMMWPRFALWLMADEVPQHTKNKRSIAALAGVAALYRKWVETAKPVAARWVAARKNAADAADAAYDAADAAAADAYAADADAAAAAAAADAAADAYAADAADAADAYARRRQADKLIELISAA